MYLKYAFAYLISSLELFCLSFFFYFVMSFQSSFNEIPSHFSVLFRNFIVVQFSKINIDSWSILLCFFRRSFTLAVTAHLLYIITRKMSILFSKFFKVFLSFTLSWHFNNPKRVFLCIFHNKNSLFYYLETYEDSKKSIFRIEVA